MPDALGLEGHLVVGSEQLDRDGAAKQGVVGAVDHARSAPAHAGVESISPVEEGSCGLVVDRVHRSSGIPHGSGAVTFITVGAPSGVVFCLDAGPGTCKGPRAWKRFHGGGLRA